MCMGKTRHTVQHNSDIDEMSISWKWLMYAIPSTTPVVSTVTAAATGHQAGRVTCERP